MLHASLPVFLTCCLPLPVPSPATHTPLPAAASIQSIEHPAPSGFTADQVQSAVKYIFVVPKNDDPLLSSFPAEGIQLQLDLEIDAMPLDTAGSTSSHSSTSLITVTPLRVGGAAKASGEKRKHPSAESDAEEVARSTQRMHIS